MALTEFEREVLWQVGDDYESAAGIAAELAGRLGRPVSAAEVLAALGVLVRAGLVAAFRYNKAEEAFERVPSVSGNEAEELSFLALPSGRPQSDRAAT
jgi:hypothetical protein